MTYPPYTNDEDTSSIHFGQSAAIDLLRAQILQIQELEQGRLAQSLHGGPIQDLSALLFQLNFLQAGNPEAAEAVKQSLKTAIADLRQHIHWLRPASLHHFGLQPALRTTVELYATKHQEIKFALLINNETRQPVPVEVGLYRIFQQAMQNIVDHANAHNVLVRFLCDADRVRLEIEDDGVGFQPLPCWEDLLAQGKIGLFSAVQQALALGSPLEIYSQPDAGTRIGIALSTAPSYGPA